VDMFGSGASTPGRSGASARVLGGPFRVGLLVLAASALALSVVELVRAAQPNGHIVSILAFAAWCTSPVLLWLGWGLVVADEGRPHRSAVSVVGAFLLPAFVAFHLLIASTDSSTASLGYVTFPLGLLLGTAVAGGIAGGLAARAADRTETSDASSRLLEEFEERVDDLRHT
jgi:hypothetical protein